MTPIEIATSLAGGDVATLRSAMDNKTKDALTEETIASVWTRLTTKLGPLRSVGDGVVLHDVPLTLERGEAHLQVVDRGGQIVGLALHEGAPTARFAG